MGIVRKSLYLATSGIVSPSSPAERIQKQQLAAVQGATPEEVRRAGGRSDLDGFFSQSPASVRNRASATQRTARPRPYPADSGQTVLVTLACGHEAVIDDPRIIGWLSADAELSYACAYCEEDQEIVAVDDDDFDAVSASVLVPAATATDLAGQIERLAALHASGALTDDEFRAAKARLLEA